MQRIALLMAALAGAAFAADTLSGPVAGYVAGSPKAELRAILGVPGSFLFSDPLPLPDGVSRIRMAPGQDFALIERGQNGPAAMVLSAGAVDHVTPIDGAMPSADWAVFSAGAQSVVLCSASANRLQVVTGLPDAPRVALDFDASALPTQPITAAVSDDGALVMAATSQAVYLVSSGAAPRLLVSGDQIRALAVLRNGKDAVAADRSTGTVYLMAAAAQADAPAPRVLASGVDGVEQVFPSQDGRTLFAARPGSLAVAAIDLASGAVQGFDAPGSENVAPSQLAPLRNRDTFLISARPRQPAWIFYRDGSAGRVAFVPAVQVGMMRSK